MKRILAVAFASAIVELTLVTKAFVNAIHDLKQSQRRLSNAQRIADMGDWEWDLKRDTFLPSDRAWRLLGHARALDKPNSEQFFATVHIDDADRLRRACAQSADTGEGFAIDHRVVNAQGKVRHLHQQVEVIERGQDGTALRLAGALHDITARKDAEDQIRRLAYYDPLTGLPNRMLFGETLARAVAQAARHQRRLAVMFVDLDNFKRVNDTLGHRAGDELLRMASARLASTLRANDALSRQYANHSASSIARLGGDEFLVLVPDVINDFQAEEIAERLVRAISQPQQLSGRKVVARCSIGIVVFPDHGDTAAALMANADNAMYQAKAGGHGSAHAGQTTRNAEGVQPVGRRVERPLPSHRQEPRVATQGRGRPFRHASRGDREAG
jgi:diguanylate cyclase (GGDEF)-like protein